MLESAEWLLENPADDELRVSRLGKGATEATLEHLLALYAAWHLEEPASGHDASASKWNSALEEWRAGRAQ